MNTEGRDMQERETVLVTGATGFLGEYLVKRLSGRYRVLGLGRNAQKGRRLEAMGAVFCPGDFTDMEGCREYFKNVQYVIHAGALSTVWGKWEDFYSTNVLGTAAVARLCRENGVRRLVYVSSPSIYTENRDRYDIREEQAPACNDLNFYIQSKLMAEREAGRWNEAGLETVILRPRGLIGVGDTSLVPRLLRANARIGIPLFRDGGNLVDLTSVENAALACELAMKAKGAGGQVFNITNGEPAEFRALLEQFLAAIGERPRYRRLPFGMVYAGAAALERVYEALGLAGEPPLTRYTVCTLGFAQTMDISKAREILGYRPEKTLAQSIREYGAWWVKHGAGETGGGDGKMAECDLAPNGAEMSSSREPRITQVSLCHCGSCTNNLGILFRARAWEKREFPATVALIRHRRLGTILYDTGYSLEILEGGMVQRLYCLLNPVHVTEGQTAARQMEKRGLRPEQVKTIILSHAHPDHIGGLKQFKGYELIASEEVLETLRRPRLKDLVFGNLVPEEGEIWKGREPGKRLTGHFLCRYFDRVYDLLGDQSIIGVVLEGHSRGQMGIWIPDVRLFLAADACWGGDLVRSTLHMRLIPRLIQKNFGAYKRTLQRLCALKRDCPDIRIVFTHQRGEERDYG